jgi:hypothetical protein
VWKNKLSQVWLYFKKGRSELFLVYGIFNNILILSLRFDFSLTLKTGAVFALVFFIVSICWGWFFARQVEPQNNIINPFSLDSIHSAISLQKSFIAFYDGDYEEARRLMQKAVDYREKWLP